MIEKNRLEELIEQGATIYSNEYGEIQLIKENDLILYENGQNNYILYALEPNKKYHNEIFDEDLFETKEDAEEYAEFGNITRTERLELPSWSEVVEYFNLLPNDEFEVIFFNDNLIYQLVIYNELIRIYFKGLEADAWDVIFNETRTKENYNEARRLCVKLFKGEEV